MPFNALNVPVVQAIIRYTLSCCLWCGISFFILPSHNIFFSLVCLLIVPPVPGPPCGILWLVQIALVAYVAGLQANLEILSQLKKSLLV